MGIRQSKTKRRKNEPAVPPGLTTYQTTDGPIVGYVQSNPPLVGPSGRMRLCTSCRRFEVQIKEPGVLNIKLSDGRYLCSDCLPISLMEPRQLEPLIRQVHNFFDDYLKLPVNKDIPVFFVDQNQLNKYLRKMPEEIVQEESGHEEIVQEESEQEEIVQEEPGQEEFVQEEPGKEDIATFGVFLYTEDTVNIVERCERNGDDIVAVTETKEIKEPTILLLFGSPKEVLGETLAHEMMHAWIWFQGWTFRLRKEVEEGICEAVAYEWLKYKWLKYTAGDYDPSYSEKDVVFIKKVMEKHKLLIKAAEIGSCGAEFWKAKHAIKKYGLKRTMKLVARKRDIPKGCC